LVQKDGATQVKVSMGNTYTVDTAYGVDDTNLEIFENEIPRLIQSTFQGYSSAFVVAGPAACSCDEFLLGTGGDEHRDGFIFQAVDALLAQADTFDEGQSSISFKCVEVANGNVVDLLNEHSHEQKLSVEQGPAGVFVEGGVSHNIFKVADFSTFFTNAMLNRTKVKTDYGPMSSKATLLVEFEVSVSKGDRTTATFTMALLPSTDKLTDKAAAVRVKEGDVNQELLGLSVILSQMSDPDLSDYVDTGVCLSGKLLSEVFGGNCVTTVLMCVPAGDSKPATATLDMLDKIKQVENYPVVNSDLTRGLLRRLRLENHHLRATGRGESTKSESSDSEQKTLEMKEKLLKSEMERAKLSEDNAHLATNYADFRGKYSALVEAKNKLQTDLIKSEEELLHVTKLVVDLQIENTDLKEAATTDKYELESKLLTVESAAIEQQMDKQKETDSKTKLAAEIKELMEEKKDLTLEYVTLKKNYTEVFAQMEHEKQKSQDIKSELLSLVNANRLLTAKNSKLEAANGSLTQDLSNSTSGAKGLSEENARLKERVQQLVAESEHHKLDAARKDVQLQKSEVAEQTTQLKHARNEQVKLATLKQLNREHEQRVRELEGQLHEANTTITDLQKKLGQLSSKFKSKIEEYMTTMQELQKGQGDSGQALRSMQRDMDVVSGRSSSRRPPPRGNSRQGMFSSPAPAAASPGAGGGGQTARIRYLEDQVRQLESERGSAVGAAQGPDQLAEERAKLNKMKLQMQEFQKNTQVKLEKERLQFKVRAQQAEEELKSFQEHMKKTVLKYQQEIVSLKKQLALAMKRQDGVSESVAPPKLGPLIVVPPNKGGSSMSRSSSGRSLPGRPRSRNYD